MLNCSINKWDLRFIKLARDVAKWSKDPKRKVGAIIVKDRRILSTGYNGFPVGFPDTPGTLNACDKNMYTVHAEANAIIAAGCNLEGATIYVAGLHPCSQCAALIAQSGITKVVYDFECSIGSSWQPSIQAAKSIFEQCNIEAVCVIPRVILIGGKKGSGKTYLSQHMGAVPILSFAALAKDMFFRTFGLQFDAVKNCKAALTTTGLTAREVMQNFATDAVQGCLGEDFWVSHLVETVLPQYKCEGEDVVVINDWRFKHEIIPGAVKLYVLGGDSRDSHISENNITPDDADIVIDNREHQINDVLAKGLLARLR